jgi:predicted O-methyltransferase YrrM
MAGQMGLGGRIGQTLFTLASRPEVQQVLEVGTWNGEGSTWCLVNALHPARGRLVSVEADQTLYEQARGFYDGKGLPVELVGGYTVDLSDIPPFETFEPRIAKTAYEGEAPGTHRAWYERELEMARKAERTNVLKDLVARDGWYDLVFLDGGEFTSDAEFRRIQPHVRRWLVMDDTNPVRSIKNAENRERVLLSPEWDVLVDDLDDRCGWLVAERR